MSNYNVYFGESNIELTRGTKVLEKVPASPDNVEKVLNCTGCGGYKMKVTISETRAKQAFDTMRTLH